MTPEKKHKKRVMGVVEQRRLSSIMNNTKWLEFKNAMYKELPFPPAYKRKDVLDDDYEAFSEDVWYMGDYEEGLLPFYSIEWIEVRPRRRIPQGRLVQDKIESIEEKFIKILEKYTIPYKVHDGSYVIYGYARASEFSQIK